MLAATIPINTTWLPAAVALIAVVLMMNSLRRRQVRSGAPKSARERVEEVRAASEARAVTDDFLVKLEEVSRQVSARIDTKIAKLEALLNEVDARAARLEAISDSVDRLRTRLTNRPLDRPRVGPNGAAPNSVAPASPPVWPADEQTEPETLPKVESSPESQSGTTVPHSARASGPSPSDTTESRRHGAIVPRLAESDTMHPENSPSGGIDVERIYRLADAGTPLPEIAEELGMQRGEVELVLDLRTIR